MTRLFLVRHGQSAWNASGKITGLFDIGLSDAGIGQAHEVGAQLQHSELASIHTSTLLRAVQTSEAIRLMLDCTPSIIQTSALDERDFGSYAGRRKSDLILELGEDTYRHTMNNWDAAPPDGVSLHAVSTRVVTFLKETIEPMLTEGNNVLIVSHHHTLKTIVQYLQNLPTSHVGDIKIPNATVLSYDFNALTKTYAVAT